MEVSLMRQLRAMAASTANSTPLLLRTGKAPGRPRQTGQTLVLGASPKRFAQEQNIVLAVRSWTWTSSPMTGSYLPRAAMAGWDVVAMIDYKGEGISSHVSQKRRDMGHPVRSGAPPGSD